MAGSLGETFKQFGIVYYIRISLKYGRRCQQVQVQEASCTALDIVRCKREKSEKEVAQDSMTRKNERVNIEKAGEGEGEMLFKYLLRSRYVLITTAKILEGRFVFK